MSDEPDHHLDDNERKRVERMVPLHQARIHCAFRGDIAINSKKYKHGAIALSEHLIVLGKRALMGKNFSPLKIFHLLDLLSFSTSSDTQCKFVVRAEPDSVNVSLESPAVLRFARILVRNYFVITLMFPIELRFQFRPHDIAKFPKFDPKMSPSQVFQFCYNAQCSYFDVTYEHAVPRFFHSMVTSGNGIADLTKLPIRLMEVNLGHPLVLRPLFGAMMFCPLIYGVVCHDIARPDIIQEIGRAHV
jgi:hypothetical protein